MISLTYKTLSHFIIRLSLNVNVRNCFRETSSCCTMLDLSDALRCRCTYTCRKQHVLSFFIWKIKWADLHQVVLLFLICMLYIMYTMNFIVLNNPLHAEHRWSCFLVMFSRQKSHVVNVAVFVFVIIQCLCLLVGFKLYSCNH